MVEKFERRMVSHLQALFPEETGCFDALVLQRHVRDSIASAARYRIVREGDVQRYLECAVLYGWEFERLPETLWVRSILENDCLDGNEKMAAIEEYQASLLENPSIDSSD